MAKAMMMTGGSVTLGKDVTRYLCVGNAAPSAEGTAAHATQTWRTAGTLSKLYCRITAHVLDTDSTIKTYKNGVPGNMALTITAGITGEFEDNSNTDALADGNTIAIQIVTGTYEFFGDQLSWTGISTLFNATDSNETVVRHAATNFPDLSDGLTYVCAITDAIESALTGSEALVRFDVNAANTWRKLQAYVSTQTGSGTTTINLRKDGVNAGPTLAITGTGLWEDLSNTHSGAANEDMNYQIVTANITTFILEFISVEEVSSVKKFHTVWGNLVLPLNWNLTRFLPIGGGAEVYVVDETSSSHDVNIDATFSNLTLYVQANSVTG